MSDKAKQVRIESVPANLLYVMADDSDRIKTNVPARDSEEYAAWVRDRDE